MASDILLRTILIVRKETRCRNIGYSFRLAARVLLYAPSHRQDSTYHGLCYTSRGALAGTRNSSIPRDAAGGWYILRLITWLGTLLDDVLWLIIWVEHCLMMFCDWSSGWNIAWWCSATDHLGGTLLDDVLRLIIWVEHCLMMFCDWSSGWNIAWWCSATDHLGGTLLDDVLRLIIWVEHCLMIFCDWSSGWNIAWWCSATYDLGGTLLDDVLRPIIWVEHCLMMFCDWSSGWNIAWWCSATDHLSGTLLDDVLRLIIWVEHCLMMSCDWSSGWNIAWWCSATYHLGGTLLDDVLRLIIWVEHCLMMLCDLSSGWNIAWWCSVTDHLARNIAWWCSVTDHLGGTLLDDVLRPIIWVEHCLMMFCDWSGRKKWNVLFNDALNTFYFTVIWRLRMVKDHSDSERGNPLPPHGLLFSINRKGSFICTIPQTGYHIPRPLLHQLWSTGWNEK